MLRVKVMNSWNPEGEEAIISRLIQRKVYLCDMLLKGEVLPKA